MASDEESVVESFAVNNDLFDAEIEPEPTTTSNEPNSPNKLIIDDEYTSGNENAEREFSDDGEDEPLENNGEKSKKIREPKKRKAKKAAVQQIHSESQRLIRESSCRLPYHQPPCKDIKHFLKRVPANTLPPKCKTLKKVEDGIPEEPSLSLSDQEAEVTKELPTVINATPVSTTETTKVTIKPQLSTALDDFFFEKPPVKKPGVDNLMQRFLKHTVNVATLKNTSTSSQEPINVPDDKNSDLEITETTEISKPKVTFSQGDNLLGLKEKLQQNMKIYRTEHRKLQESRRRLDNEEVSDEEEEEEFEDEDDADSEDSDFEMDVWNSKDETEQERHKLAATQHDSNEIDDEDAHDDEGDGENVVERTVDEESNTQDKLDPVNSSDISLDGMKMQEDPVKRHVQDERTMDLFSSDVSNQYTNQTAEDDDDENSNDSCESIKLRLDSIGDTQDGSNTDYFTKVKSPSKHQEHSSDTSNIQAGQGQFGSKETESKGLTQFSSIKKLLGVDCPTGFPIEKKPRPISELTLPVEDSQDLYDEDDGNEIRRLQNTSISKDFHFALDEDTQFTQFVDTQGYLLSAKKKKNALENEKFKQANMSELLGLCSGTFSDKTTTKADSPGKQSSNMSELLGLCSGKFTDKTQAKTSFDYQKNQHAGLDSGHDSSKDDMSELLGLCSGQFDSIPKSKDTKTEDMANTRAESGIFSALEQKSKKKSKQGLSAMFDAMSNKNNIDDAVALCSGNFPTTEKEVSDQPEFDGELYDMEDNDKDDISDNEVFSDDEQNKESEDEASIVNQKSLKKYGISYGKAPRTVFDKKNFLEDEAELSGSEASSDEEENEEDDELEEESDIEDLPSDEELHRQVNKVHMKSVQDEDQRDLRAFKERYLEDGDLYSEGGGRRRNFKWQGLEDSQGDMFENKFLWGDEEVMDSELLSQEELERRKMKHEKDQFIQQQIQCDNIEGAHAHIDENSQNILNLIKDTSSVSGEVKKVVVKPVQKPQAPKITNATMKRGSFLNRSKDQMNRLSSITAVKTNPVAARGFVFHTVSPATKNRAAAKAKKLERSVSLSEPPNPKRPKLDRTFSEIATNSLFAMM